MTEDRLMVAEAVMAGQIPESHLTLSEIDELFEIACDAATDKLMVEAEARGCSVFPSIPSNTLQPRSSASAINLSVAASQAISNSSSISSWVKCDSGI